MRAFWLFLSLVFVVACGAAPLPVALSPAPKSMAHLTFYVLDHAQLSGDMAAEHAALQESLPDAVSSALTKAGFQVVTDKAQRHDAVVKVSANVTLLPSFMTMQVNGKIVKNALARVKLNLEANGTKLDQIEADSSGGNPEAQDALDRVTAELVNSLEKSSRVAAFAKKGAPEGSAVADASGDDAADPGDAPAPKAAPKKSHDDDDAERPAPRAAALAGAAQPKAYALVIGIEKYRDVPPPTGARGDAEKFARLAHTALGVPEENIRTAYDDRATKGDIEKQLRWLKANVEPGGRIYFYFSGHGAPDATNGTPYLLPYDGDPKFIDQTAIQLSNVLASLSDTKAGDVLAILDSCFSGAGGRSVLPPGARPLVRMKETPVPAGARLAVLSASGGGEISGPVPNGTGGLFTKHVADGLAGQADTDGDGKLSLKELYDFVKPRVAKDARRDNREQTPTLTTGRNVGDGGGFVVAAFKGKK